MSARTIDLTRTKPDLLEPILKQDYVYDNPTRRANIASFYKEQRVLVKLFDDEFNKLNQEILLGLDNFMKDALNLDRKSLFPDHSTGKLHAALLSLNMQVSDHEKIFEMIERHVENAPKKIKFISIKPILTRKRGVVDLLNSSSCRQSKNIFVLIERAETFDCLLFGTLVGYLNSRIRDDPNSPTSTIMILFCVSGKVQNLPLDTVGCFENVFTICQTQDLTQQQVLDILLRAPGLSFKLGPRPISGIYESFLNCDASLASVSYMFRYAMFKRCVNSDLESCPASKRRNTRIISSPDGGQEIGDPLGYHEYICNQLYYLFDLIQERGMFPRSMIDLYDELFAYNDLSLSAEVWNAIDMIKKFPTDALLRRINTIEDRARKIVKPMKGLPDLASTLKQKKDMLLNNENCRLAKEQFVEDVKKHLRAMRNPALFSTLYFNKSSELMQRALPASRGHYYTQMFRDDLTYFGILFNTLLLSNGQVNANDLYEEVSPSIKKLIQKVNSGNENVQKKGSEKSDTPKKVLRLSVRAKTTDKKRKREKDVRMLTPSQEEGLCKAIFIDLLDAMEQMHLLKLDKRRSRGGIIKRLVWLN